MGQVDIETTYNVGDELVWIVDGEPTKMPITQIFITCSLPEEDVLISYKCKLNAYRSDKCDDENLIGPFESLFDAVAVLKCVDVDERNGFADALIPVW